MAPQPHPHSGSHGNLQQDQQISIPNSANTGIVRTDLDANSQEIQGSQIPGIRPGLKKIVIEPGTKSSSYSKSDQHGDQQPLGIF